MNIPELIESALIVEQLEAPTKTAALAAILERVAAAGGLAKKDLAPLRKALLEREQKASTGIGWGIAVPHVKAKQVQKLALVLARSPKGIDFNAIDGKPVHTIFLILAPPNEPEGHLLALRWISTLARNADFRRFVLQATSEAQIRELLREMG